MFDGFFQLLRWRVPLSIKVVLSLVDEVRIIIARSGMRKTYKVSTGSIFILWILLNILSQVSTALEIACWRSKES
jgi:hypothetical protein